MFFNIQQVLKKMIQLLKLLFHMFKRHGEVQTSRINKIIFMKRKIYASFVVMLLTFRTMQELGCNLGARTLILAIFPVVLLCGPTLSSLAIGVVFFLASRTDWILTNQDRSDIDNLVLPKLTAAGVPIRSLWP